MQGIKRGSAFVLLFGIAIQAQTGIPVPQLARFDSAMTRLLTQHKVPGGQMAITYQGRLVYNRGFGYADTASKSPVEPGTVFRLASVSKPITSVAIIRLVEQGKLRLQDTVFGEKGILKDTSYRDILDDRAKAITVTHLLDHSAGWNRDVSGDPMFDAYAIAKAMGVPPPADAKTVIRYVLAKKRLDFAPGTSANYSNLGFNVLGRIIEAVTGKGYEAYVREEILLPLGLPAVRLGSNRMDARLPGEATYYHFNPNSQALSVYDNTTLVPWPYGGFNVEAMDAHGGWVASAADLCKLLAAVDKYPTFPDILSSASLQAMTKPSPNDPYYGLGWAVNSLGNYWHMGSLPGTTTMVARANNQINWSILLNYRPQNASALNAAVDALMWDVLPSITAWPASDQFTAIRAIPASRFGILGESGRLLLYDASGRKATGDSRRIRYRMIPAPAPR